MNCKLLSIEKKCSLFGCEFLKFYSIKINSKNVGLCIYLNQAGKFIDCDFSSNATEKEQQKILKYLRP
jgi:hypothetical protein